MEHASDPDALPNPDSVGLEEATVRLKFHRQLVCAAHDGLSRMTNDGWVQEPAEEVWPPDDEWHFRPNQFAFMRRRYTANGVLGKLLEVLAKSRWPKNNNELILKILTDSDVIEPLNIRNLHSHLSKLRKLLRKAFGLPKGFDPIPRSKGEAKGWRLDTESIRNHITTV